MKQNTLTLMKTHEYFRGLPNDILVDVEKHIMVQRFHTGDLVQAANEPSTRVGFLVSGRLKGMMVDAEGGERLLRFAERGEQIGMMSVSLAEPLPINVIAVEPSTILFLEYETAFDLTSKHPALRRHWNQRLAGALRTQLLGDTASKRTSVVTFLHSSPDSRESTFQLIGRFRELGENLGVFSDRSRTEFSSDIRFRHLVDNDREISAGELHQQMGEWDDLHRIVMDVDAAIDSELATRLIALSNKVVWITRPKDHPATLARLRELESITPGFKDKISLAWLLDDEPLAPVSTELGRMVQREFMIFNSKTATPYGLAVGQGLERLVHFLRGLQIGLALGGGAARGMAHLGVLRALERHGIVIDRIAGTSAGAMTGVLYAAGLDPDYLVEQFVRDLKPSPLFRWSPRGPYWYLLYKYRRGQFDPMLRKYLNDCQLEQLPIPCSAITVDLVSGRAIVRRSGDAVHSIVDSINLPLLSTPILRQGQALVDGGFVNNVPADVLADQGCNLVIAVDVLAKIEEEFANIRPDTSVLNPVSPNTLQTLLRTYAVQSYNMNAIGAQPADVRVEPDVSDFSMAAFTQAAEMADIGEAALDDRLETIKKLIANWEKRQHGHAAR